MHRHNRSKKISVFFIATVFLCALSSSAFALPQGEQIVAGDATYTINGNTLTITIGSEKFIANYDSFSIGAGELVRFLQPSSSSYALNRVIGTDPSVILGSLTANGNIFLINPNGILFGAGSRIDVGGLVASTLDISNEDFLAGRYNFSGKANYVVNEGMITAQPGGYICLLGGAISNKGTIIADLGTVALASGAKTTLNLDDVGAISVVVEEAAQEAVFGPDGARMASAIKNSGTIQANGGKVVLTAKVLNNVFDYAINNEGIIEAQSLGSKDGKVILSAEGAPIRNAGTIKATNISITAPQEKVINDGLIYAQEKVSIEADSLETTKNQTDEQGNPVSGVYDSLIQAKEIQILAKKIGGLYNPIALYAGSIYIGRTQGDIDLLASLLMGDNVLLRGPPDGFGAIVYNKDSNLTLDSLQGRIFVGNNVTLVAKNLSLLAQDGIYSEGSLLPTQDLYLISNGPITSIGVLKARNLYERGASFLVGGVFHVVHAYAQNADGAINLNTGNYNGLIQDPVK
jgi:filamentous hemagglutinin family protein